MGKWIKRYRNISEINTGETYNCPGSIFIDNVTEDETNPISAATIAYWGDNSDRYRLITAGTKVIAVRISNDNKKIVYKTKTGRLAWPWLNTFSTVASIGYGYEDFGARIVSNEIEGEYGVIRFDVDVSKICPNAFFKGTNTTDIEHIYFPDSITEIGDNCFGDCEKLIDITIPDNVTKIGKECFKNCFGLQDIVIGEGVNDIGLRIFENCYNLKTIYVSEENSAFKSEGNAILSKNGTELLIGCNNTDCDILTAITKISPYCFQNCDKITKIPNSESTLKIGEYAFSNCLGLISASCPSVKTIGRNAFESCTNLSNFEVGDYIESISGYSFSNCIFLESFKITKDTCPLHEDNVFNGISNFKIRVKEAKLSHYKELWAEYKLNFYPYDTLYEIDYKSIDNKAITPYCFISKRYLSRNVGLQDFGAYMDTNTNGVIQFKSKLTSIGKNSFYEAKNRDNLTKITLYDGIEEIRDKAFSECKNLTSINIPNTVNVISDGAFSLCGKLSDITIGSAVTSIGAWAFSECSSLGNITIPNSVTFLDRNAFMSCKNLESITLSNGLSEIPLECFCSSGLKEIIVPENIETINEYAFDGCKNLEYIELPSSIQSIYDGAFDNCGYNSEIFNIKIKAATPPEISLNLFDSQVGYGTDNFRIYVPMINVEDYVREQIWYDYRDFIHGYIDNNTILYETNNGAKIWPIKEKNGSTYSYWGIGEGYRDFGANIISNEVSGIYGKITFDRDITKCGMFGGNVAQEHLVKVSLPDCVTELITSAFTDCHILSNISIFDSDYTLSSNLNKIGDYVFTNCYSLGNITIPLSVTTIGASAFESCSGLTSITLPLETLRTIEDKVFYNCKKLTSIYIPNSVTSIGDESFRYCNSLTSCTLCNSISSIGSKAFLNCPKLKTFNGSHTGISSDHRTIQINGVLKGFAPSGLTTYALENRINTIDEYVFSASNLTQITFPSSLSTIKEYAFQGSELTYLNLPSSLTSIKEGAFSYCSSLTSVDASNCANLRFDGEKIFYYCINLISVYFNSNCNRLTEIPPYTFYSDDIINLELPDCVNEIGDYAFADCTQLPYLVLPKSITTIKQNAFNGCGDLDYYLSLNPIPPTASSDSFLGDSNCPVYVLPESYSAYTGSTGGWQFLGSRLKCAYEIKYASSTDEILKFMVGNGTSGEFLELNDGKDYFGANLICYYKNEDDLRWIFDDAITKFGKSSSTYSEYLYIYSYGLLSEINLPSTITEIGYRALSETSISSITLGAAIVSLGISAFEVCNQLESVDLSACENLSEISKYAFFSCNNLKNITFFNGDMDTIREFAFSECNFETISLPPRLSVIENRAFSYNPSLKYIELPASVETIGDFAFEFCDNLQYIQNNSIVPQEVNGDTLCDTNECPIYVPLDSLYVYLADTNWEYYWHRIQPIIANNQIIYESNNGIIWPVKSFDYETEEWIEYGLNEGEEVFGANIISNSDDTGIGILTFDGDVTAIGNFGDIDTCGHPTKAAIDLTKIYFPQTVTRIDDLAFYLCDNLTEIKLPLLTETIGEWAFDGCVSLTSCTIGNLVTSIGDYAFHSCESLTSINIPDSVTSIGDYAFDDCFGLISVTLGNKVNSIGYRCFMTCNNLTSINIPDSVTFIGNFAFDGCSSLISCTIGSGLTVINGYTFSNCDTLYEFEIPETVKTVKSFAFKNTPIEVFVVGSGLLTVENGALSLPTVKKYEGNNPYISVDGRCLRDKNKNLIAFAPNELNEEYIFVDNISTIKSYSINLDGCVSLTNLVLPETLIAIEDFGVCNNSTLQNLIIPSSVNNLGNFFISADTICFTGITGFNVPKIASNTFSYVNHIIVDNDDYSTFYDEWTDDNVRNKLIGGNIKSIEYTAYSVVRPWEKYEEHMEETPEEGYIVTAVTYNYGTNGEDAGVESLGTVITANTFSDNNGKIYCNDIIKMCSDFGLPSDYPTWSSLYGGYDTDATYRLTSITLPLLCKTIYGNCFNYCQELESVTIPYSVTSIGSCAFHKCTKLMEFNGTHPGITDDGRLVIINNCVEGFAPKGLTAITIPNGVTKIGHSVFKDCTNLSRIIIPNSVSEIEYNAFYNIGGQEGSYYIKYTSTASTDNPYAISCRPSYSFKSVSILQGTKFIGDECFERNDYLTAITIPNSVTSIGEWAFSYCRNLTGITIPNSVTSIGAYAFYYCTKITKITIRATVPPTLGSNALTGMSKLTNIYVPSGSVENYKKAHGWSQYASKITSI